MKKQKIILFILVVAMFFLFPMSSISAKANNDVVAEARLTQEEITRIDPYVTKDSAGHYFILSSEAAYTLSSTDYFKAIHNIKIANKKMDDLNSSIPVLSYTDGKTDAEWHWWGVTVYLSKVACQSALTGAAAITIGSVGIMPGPAVLLLIGGIYSGSAIGIPGGIAFDVYWPEIPFVFSGNPINYAIMAKISNVRWQ